MSARFGPVIYFFQFLCANIFLSASLVQCSSCFIFTLFSFISVGLNNSRLWLETAPLTDSPLRDTVPGLSGLQLDAKAPSTVLKIRVWLIVVALVGFIEDWCFCYSKNLCMSHCIYLS